MSDLVNAIRQASERGWRVFVMIDGVDSFDVRAERGDSNCPRSGPYSKSDHHGYETVEAEEELESLDKVAAWLLALEDYKR